VVPRVLHYVGLLLLFTLLSTFPWWAAANAVRAEYRRLLSALACAMRIFFYSICLLCILVVLQSLHLAPADPRSTLFGRIHLAGTVAISVPSAWRAFRVRGARLAALVATGLLLCAALGWLAALASPGFRSVVRGLPARLGQA
jgi:hypothetical protein